MKNLKNIINRNLNSSKEMNILSIFGAGKSEKKKKKNKRHDKLENEVYALKGVKMYVSSLMGSGPKKQ